jgi:IclR family pca regulon transcriptional regulator
MSLDAATAISPKDLIEGLGKGLRVIEAFDDDHPRLTASEAGRLAGISRTAARRHLLSLVHFGYAATDGKQFWLAPRVLRLGQSYLGAARLPRLVQPSLHRISTNCGETVNVSVLDGHEVVYVAQSSPPRSVSIGYHVGVRVPAHVVTPGVVMLAARDDASIEAWTAAHDFVSFTAHTVTDTQRFLDEVRSARAQEFWSTVGQLDVGLCGIAVPLKNRKGACIAALSVSAPVSRYAGTQMAEKLLPLLRETAQALRPLL